MVQIGRRRIAWNKVLVLPDEDHKSVSGLSVEGSDTPQWHWAVTGLVVCAPERNLFFQPGRPRDDKSIQKSRRQYSYSQYYNSPVEVSAGDRVMFDFVAKYDTNSIKIDDAILIRYDNLIAVKKNGKWKPLNGFLIVELHQFDAIEEVSPMLYLERKDLNKYGYAKVIYSGSPVMCFNGEKVNPSHIPEGASVLYEKNSAVGIELDIHAGGKRLYKLHTKDVLLWG